MYNSWNEMSEMSKLKCIELFSTIPNKKLFPKDCLIMSREYAGLSMATNKRHEMQAKMQYATKNICEILFFKASNNVACKKMMRPTATNKLNIAYKMNIVCDFYFK